MQTRRPIAAFDIDGTVIRWQLYHAIGDELARRGHISPDEFARVKDARMNWKRRSDIDSYRSYEDSLVQAFNNGIRGMEVGHLEDIANSVFQEYREQVYTYTRDLIARLKADNYLLFAVSGSPSAIVKRFTEFYGFDDYAATNFLSENGRLTGERDLAVGKKAELLQALVKKYGASYRGSVAVGDSEGDIAMLGLVERPIAFNPSRELFLHARKAGWEIIVERKNVIYDLEPDSGSYLLAETGE